MITLPRLYDLAVRATAVASITLTLYGCNSTGAGAASTASGDPADFALLQTVARVVQRNYVEPVPGDELTRDALDVKRMLASLTQSLSPRRPNRPRKPGTDRLTD